MTLSRSRCALWALSFLVLCSPQLSISVSPAYGEQGSGSVFEGQALATTAKGISGVLIFSFEADDISPLKALPSSVRQAALEEFRRGKGVFVSPALAQQLSITPGDLLMLANPTGQGTPFGSTPLIIHYHVLGIVNRSLLPGSDAAVYLRRTEAKKIAE
ncbi:hypothetical protein HGP17_20095 [Rhizobium sp. P38BS-XIX]|uniref:hypothetical protein n=1 Tax=Rhizobium sp. P38BS-XIX TaxID=2726740 RepID=UPI00145746AB|nr:hypothetical protein [Rhizobium sp. P38BS-XIX]NLR99128.1 hypothetical protein [Rhizobium sp. P38BS-XIX]